MLSFVEDLLLHLVAIDLDLLQYTPDLPLLFEHVLLPGLQIQPLLNNVGDVGGCLATHAFRLLPFVQQFLCLFWVWNLVVQLVEPVLLGQYLVQTDDLFLLTSHHVVLVGDEGSDHVLDYELHNENI